MLCTYIRNMKSSNLAKLSLHDTKMCDMDGRADQQRETKHLKDWTIKSVITVISRLQLSHMEVDLCSPCHCSCTEVTPSHGKQGSGNTYQ